MQDVYTKNDILEKLREVYKMESFVAQAMAKSGDNSILAYERIEGIVLAARWFGIQRDELAIAMPGDDNA